MEHELFWFNEHFMNPMLNNNNFTRILYYQRFTI